MNRKQGAIYVGFVGFLLLLGVFIHSGFAQQREELQIGLPDFPRRIVRTLPPLRPDQEIKFGILKLHPSFKTSVEYDDNILLSKNKKKEDVIFTQIPAIEVETKLGDHHFEGGYGAEIVDFVKDGEENAVNHLANSTLDLNFKDLKLKIQDVFENSTSRLFSETSVRDRLLINTVEILGTYDRPKWALETGWRHNTLEHRTDVLNGVNLEEDIVSVLGGYKILPKTLLLVENDVGFVTYHHSDEHSNQKYWQIFGGLRGDPTDKFTLTAKLGFQERQLEEIVGQGRQSDFEGVVSNIDLLYKFDPSSSARLGYIRTARVSTFGANGWYRQDQIFATYTKRFLHKWVLTPEFTWEFHDYPEQATSGGITKQRDDNFWFTSVELRYEIQEWLSTGIAYRFRNRNSNMDVFDFRNNRVMFDITLAY